LKSRCVVVVNAYSSGRFLAAEAAHLGFACVHVRTQHDLAEDRETTFRPDDFVEELRLTDSYADLVNQIAKKWIPKAILTGCDAAVHLSDRLARTFNLPGNSPESSSLRRSKFDMNVALSEVRPTVKQVLVKEDDDPPQKIREFGLLPMVVKPLASSGSEDVVICETYAHAEQCVSRIVGKQNSLDEPNDCALLQQFLRGPQYVINAVSRAGEHIFTDLWKVKQARVDSGSMITNYKWSLRGSDPVTKCLLEFGRDLLDACEIVNGPSHSEVRITSNGPMLIETSGRLMGASLEPEFFREAFGCSQARLTLECLTDCKSVYTKNPYIYAPPKSMAMFHLNLKKSGKFKHVKRIDRLTSLSSFRGFTDLPKPGHTVYATSMNIARAGYLYLVNENAERLQQDIKITNDLLDGIFQIDNNSTSWA